MNTAASDSMRITKRCLCRLSCVGRRLPKRLGMPLFTAPYKATVVVIAPFVVSKIARLEMRSLFQNDDLEPRGRKLLRYDSAGSARANDDEVHSLARGISYRCLLLSHAGYSPFAK